jgi:large subunit ribosomal protein L4
MKIAVKNLQNAEVGQIELADAIYGLELRSDILHRVVNWQRAKSQTGNHKTKGISEIQGTSKKPFKQKGTGNARQGSLRSAQMRGGATIFGPLVRSHAYSLPKKIRALGLKMALSSKAASGKLLVLDSTDVKTPKTKEMAAAFDKMGLKSVLFIDGEEVNTNFALAARNIPNVDILPAQGANVLSILRRDTLVLTKAAIEKLQERLGGTAA